MSNPADNSGTVSRIARAFCQTMVWADAEEGTSPGVPKATLMAAQTYVRAFLTEYPDICKAALESDDYGWHQGVHDTADAFGHDLYLTARGHGAGFADRTGTLGETATTLHSHLRVGWRRWEIEMYQANGWVYLIDRATEAQQGSDIP